MDYGGRGLMYHIIRHGEKERYYVDCECGCSFLLSKIDFKLDGEEGDKVRKEYCSCPDCGKKYYIEDAEDKPSVTCTIRGKMIFARKIDKTKKRNEEMYLPITEAFEL